VGGWRGKSRKQFVHTYIHTDNIETNMKNKTNKAVLREEGFQRKNKNKTVERRQQLEQKLSLDELLSFFTVFVLLLPLVLSLCGTYKPINV